MHGPICIFWANLTPFSLKGLTAEEKQWIFHDTAAKTYRLPMLSKGEAKL
jgi:hypothetical protein